ncbi:MAG: Fe2+-dependent dioxygenase [Giesbergeria sp.]
MFLHLKNLLNAQEVAQARGLLGDGAPWVDGRTSAGAQALAHKRNQQLAQTSEAAGALRPLVLAALQRDPLFFSAALPRKVFNPLFNRYSGDSNFYGAHVDGAVLRSQATGEWVRSDLSCTVFLSGPEEYDGGELLIAQPGGDQRIKLAAGDAILYPGSTVHQVTPVTRGARIASFFWVQSMVRSTEQRELLFAMDMDLLRLRQSVGESDSAVVGLTGSYHNLLRMWADA